MIIYVELVINVFTTVGKAILVSKMLDVSQVSLNGSGLFAAVLIVAVGQLLVQVLVVLTTYLSC